MFSTCFPHETHGNLTHFRSSFHPILLGRWKLDPRAGASQESRGARTERRSGEDDVIAIWNLEKPLENWWDTLW